MAGGMAKHSISSFDEADAIRILSDVLESTHKIKTFFKENDRTPNHDGNFELVAQNGEPKKQFIVQIKKTKELQKCRSGKNKGKYVYSLETPFLYYVKEKVTESPAIYFVVDIETNRIFYIYLSDEVLMNLDFEGKEKVTYAFSEQQILSDVELFYKELVKIADSRNRGFVLRSAEEIAELQEAADYINDLFNGDLKRIKETCFPDLWRFGIGFSQTENLKIGHKGRNGEEVIVHQPQTANMFGLLPQFKGRRNQEIGDFQWNNLGTIIDCVGNRKPIDYAKDSVHNIVQRFCQNPPSKLLPTIVLEEKVYRHAYGISTLFKEKKDYLDVDDIYRKMNAVFTYLDLIFFQRHEDSENEKQFKQMVGNLLKIHPNCIDLQNPLMMGVIVEDLNKFCEENNRIKYNVQNVFSLLTLNTIILFVDLLELKERDITIIDSQWKGLYKAINDDDALSVESICDKWVSQLPNVYYEFYRNVFSRNNEYRYECKAEYFIKREHSAITDGMAYYIMIDKYKSEEDSICITKSVKEEDDNIVNGNNNSDNYRLNMNLFNLACDKRLLYDGIRCWLYQGISNRLGFKPEGIALGHGFRECLF